MLSRWCRDDSINGGSAFPGDGKPRDEEMASLKRKLVRVRKEPDFLKEAAAYFEINDSGSVENQAGLTPCPFGLTLLCERSRPLLGILAHKDLAKQRTLHRP